MTPSKDRFEDDEYSRRATVADFFENHQSRINEADFQIYLDWFLSLSPELQGALLENILPAFVEIRLEHLVENLTSENTPLKPAKFPEPPADWFSDTLPKTLDPRPHQLRQQVLYIRRQPIFPEFADLPRVSFHADQQTFYQKIF
ncbi:MAG: hypothetical protein AAF226_00950, partial [Verrucomicrobiota bacterium]